jgi:hypothetical protein
MKINNFKLPGMIGGDSENAMTYNSLLFEMENGRKNGHKDSEMCSVIISKTADKETREYFETTPDIELQDVLDMLKSACCTEKGSNALFTQFTNDSQGREELPLTFITRVLRLRRRVYTLGLEENNHFDQNMLAKRSFQVMFSGLRDENIRSALREKCKDDYELKDKVIHKYASDIIAAEEERKLKLFGKPLEATVQAMSTKTKVSNEAAKREKLNPFAKIEELREEQEKRYEGMRIELNEIKKLIISSQNRNSDSEPKEEHKEKKSGKGKKARRCPQCTADNKYRCYHCWECGKDGHRREECPENE